MVVPDIHDTQFNTKFRKIYQNIDLPFYLCLGNHDYHSNAQSQIDYTFSQYNIDKKWNLPSKFYTKSFLIVIYFLLIQILNGYQKVLFKNN